MNEPQGQTITKENHRDVLRYVMLCSATDDRSRRNAFLSLGSELFCKKQTPVFQQPPYSPDLAPCDFLLFSKLERILEGTRFQTREEIMSATIAELYSIQKNAFSICF
nr:unnamed protein product [Callosobruchus chinensis]